MDKGVHAYILIQCVPLSLSLSLSLSRYLTREEERLLLLEARRGTELRQREEEAREAMMEEDRLGFKVRAKAKRENECQF